MIEGWALSAYSGYYHYFVDHVPLCNGCGLPIDLPTLGNDDSDSNCPRCKTLLKERVAPVFVTHGTPQPFTGSSECSVCHKPSENLYKGVCQECRLRKTWEEAKK